MQQAPQPSPPASRTASATPSPTTPFIYSRHEPRIDISARPRVTYVTEVETAMEGAKQAVGEEVSVYGAAVVRLAQAAGVLGELERHVVPVLLGKGRGPFEGLDREHIELERVRVLVGAHGVTHLRHRVRPGA